MDREQRRRGIGESGGGAGRRNSLGQLSEGIAHAGLVAIEDRKLR